MIELVRRINPLVLCITNDVVKPFTANGLLALGASPIMSGEKKEMADIVKHSGAVLINIGTCTEDKIPLYENAAKESNQNQLPLVLDPVGYGASKFRRDVTNHILDNYKVDLIKGNTGEIMALAGMDVETKGVDSIASGQAEDIVKTAYEKLNVPILVTGKSDAFTDGENLISLDNGHEFQEKVTGSGCLLGAICASFLAVERTAGSIVKAVSLYNIAAEKAALISSGPGMFQVQLIDEIYKFTEEDYRKAEVTFHE